MVKALSTFSTVTNPTWWYRREQRLGIGGYRTSSQESAVSVNWPAARMSQLAPLVP
jgi:hypothetical protein